MRANRELHETLSGVFAEMAVAVNELADACRDDELRERFFAFKRCFERGVVLCSNTETNPRGEEAPEFASVKGESCRIEEL
jgi:hypothetical protein